MTVKRNELVLENKWDGLGDTLKVDWYPGVHGYPYVELRVDYQNGSAVAEFNLSQKQATQLAKFLLGE